jgi:hypothetical protein
LAFSQLSVVTKIAGTAKSDDRAQGQPGEWSDQEQHDRGRRGDQTGKCSIGADVPDRSMIGPQRVAPSVKPMK